MAQAHKELEPIDTTVQVTMFEVGKSLQNAEANLRENYPGWADVCKHIFDSLDSVLGDKTP